MSQFTKITTSDLRYGLFKTLNGSTSPIFLKQYSRSIGINRREFSSNGHNNNDEHVVTNIKTKYQASRDKRNADRQDEMESKIISEQLDKEYNPAAYSKFYHNDPLRAKAFELSKTLPQLTSTMDLLVNAFPDEEDDPSTLSTEADDINKRADLLNNYDEYTEDTTISGAFLISGSELIDDGSNAPQVNLNNVAFEFVPPQPIIMHPEVGKLSKEKQIQFIKGVSFISQIFNRLDSYLKSYSDKFTKNELSYFENAMRVLREEYYNNEDFRKQFNANDDKAVLPTSVFKLTMEESVQANKDVEALLKELLNELEKEKITSKDSLQMIKEYNEDLDDYLPIFYEEDEDLQKHFHFDVAEFLKKKGIETTLFKHLASLKSIQDRADFYKEFSLFKNQRDVDRNNFTVGPSSSTLNSLVDSYQDYKFNKYAVELALREFTRISQFVGLSVYKLKQISEQLDLNPTEPVADNIESKEESIEIQEGSEFEDIKIPTPFEYISNKSKNRITRYVKKLVEQSKDTSLVEIQIAALMSELNVLIRQFNKRMESNYTAFVESYNNNNQSSSLPSPSSALPTLFELKDRIQELLQKDLNNTKEIKSKLSEHDELFIDTIRAKLEATLPENTTKQQRFEYTLNLLANSGIKLDFELINRISSQEEQPQAASASAATAQSTTTTPPQPTHKNGELYKPVQLIKALYKLGPGKFRDTVENLKRLPNLVYYCQYINNEFLDPKKTYISTVDRDEKLRFPTLNYEPLDPDELSVLYSKNREMLQLEKVFSEGEQDGQEQEEGQEPELTEEYDHEESLEEEGEEAKPNKSMKPKINLPKNEIADIEQIMLEREEKKDPVTLDNRKQKWITEFEQVDGLPKTEDLSEVIQEGEDITEETTDQDFTEQDAQGEEQQLEQPEQQELQEQQEVKEQQELQEQELQEPLSITEEIELDEEEKELISNYDEDIASEEDDTLFTEELEAARAEGVEEFTEEDGEDESSDRSAAKQGSEASDSALSSTSIGFSIVEAGEEKINKLEYERTMAQIQSLFPFFGVDENDEIADMELDEKLMLLETKNLLFKGNIFKNPGTETPVFIEDAQGEDAMDVVKSFGYDEEDLAKLQGEDAEDEIDQDEQQGDGEQGLDEYGEEKDPNEEEEEEEEEEGLQEEEDRINDLDDDDDYINYRKGLVDIDWDDTPELSIKNLVTVGRHTSVTKAGRVFNFSATVFNGDGEGTASRGYGKGDTAVAALKRATRDAERRAFTLDLFREHTLPSGLDIKYRSTKIRFYKSKGYDQMDHSGYKQTLILPTIGLHGVTFRTFGRRNWNNVLLAIQNGLPKYTNPEEAARIMGKRFVVPNEELQKKKTLSQLLQSKLKKKNNDPYNLGMVSRFLYDLEEKPNMEEIEERRMNAELKDLMKRYPQEQEEEMQEKDFKYGNLLGKKRIDRMDEGGRRHERNIKSLSI